MKEKEIFNNIIQNEMPDIEQVRLNCTSYSPVQGVRHIKTIVIAAVLAVILGTTAFAIANNDRITLFFEGVPEQASQVREYDYYKSLEQTGVTGDGISLTEEIWEKPNYQGSEYIIEFSHYDEINSLFDTKIGNKLMDIVQLAQLTHIQNDDGEWEPHIYSIPRTNSLIIHAKDGVPDHAFIQSQFTVNNINFLATIFIPLETDFDFATLFNDGFIENSFGDKDEIFYFCTAGKIHARFLTGRDPQNAQLGLTIQFTHKGAYYQIEKLLEITEEPASKETILETAQIIINAFD